MSKKLNEKTGLIGIWEFVLRDVNTGEIISKETVKNLIVNSGLERMARRLGSAVDFFNTIKIGTGTNAAGNTDTALQTLYASELASFIGLHKYKIQSSTWSDVWARYHGGKHQELALTRIGGKFITDQEYIDKICDKTNTKRISLEGVREVGRESKNKNKLDENILKLQEDTSRMKTSNATLYKELHNVLEREMLGSYGTAREEHSLAGHEKRHNVEITSKNDKFYMKWVFTTSKRKYGIGGRID